ncbi:hypothetical protein ANO14919_102840 [Xylariales sp. No.14919]|nr:hypothetical protein ANO14919_102840 [Xylariales sp. No.14919]
MFFTLALASSYATCLHNLGALYLVEAVNEGVTLPFLEELPRIIEIPKWSATTSALDWTSVYLVKMTFLYFFHTLVQGLPRRIIIFYWAAVAFSFVFWIYSTFTSIIVCPHFGADSAKCSPNPDQHVRSLSNDVLVAAVDIICDTLSMMQGLAVLVLIW